jgi:hypothetical protein
MCSFFKPVLLGLSVRKGIPVPELVHADYGLTLESDGGMVSPGLTGGVVCELKIFPSIPIFA